MVNVFNVETYEPKPTDKFLFDTNILVFLFNSLNPKMEDNKPQIYSDFLRKILNVNATIYLTSLNLSEFINVLISREFQIKKAQPNFEYSNKKDFRNSSDYNYAISEIKPIVKNMLKNFKKISDNFEELSIDNLVDNLKIDFNDEYYNYFCNYNDLKLLTDDFDYNCLNSPLDIITANKKYNII